jgi:hypothetical protein
MATDLETAIEYYKDLLLYKYINAPNARATIGLLCSQALVDLLPIEMNNAFDIDTAVGPQLDILGEYIGFNRTINTPIARDYFTLDDYITPAPYPYGMTSYLDATLNANISMYEYIFTVYSLTTLSDSEYRILLKLKLLSNISQHCLYGVNELLHDVFGDSVIVCDQYDMTISYFVTTELSRILSIALAQNLLPKPMGVLISGLFSSDVIADFWGLTSYSSTSWSTIGLSAYATGFVDATMLDYLDRI